MNCLNTKCENEVTRDYPVCGLHESTAHFTNRADCRCGDCQAKRAEIVDISGLNDLPQFAAVDADFHVINGIDPDYEAYLAARESMQCGGVASALTDGACPNCGAEDLPW